MIEGATPMRASVSAKVLSGPATAISAAPTRPKPPARTWPLTAMTTGSGSSRMSRSSAVSWPARSLATSWGSDDAAELSDRSAPAQNVLPVWVSTTARTVLSAAARCSPSRNCRTKPLDNALRLCGESSVRRAARPSTSYWTSVSLMGCLL
ncbi:Uncharacterised protein [Mycobacteroides abscessus subsp. massiliense]|nr:Uncharacterised protein [Mycobacteroides abscessus subsp. massiliense]